MTIVNGIDKDKVAQLVKSVAEQPQQRTITFQVRSHWEGGMRVKTRTESITQGEQKMERSFAIVSDEPENLGGQDSAPNPQELLMAALNACLGVGYAVGAAMQGIELTRLEIETEGTLDLRGFLGLDDQVSPGYENIRYHVYMAGNGTEEQFAQIHAHVQKTSPNFYNLSRPIPIEGKLVVIA